MDIEFIKDCVSNSMSLKDIGEKYGIPKDEVYDVFMEERKKYSESDITQIIYEVYYE